MKAALLSGLLGASFGFALSRIGFTSWQEVHRMFTLADFRLILTFAVAIALLAVAWLVIARATSTSWSPRPIHPGTLAGGVLFGAGWAISGACPSIALVQLGEGQLGAGWTIVGIVGGNWLYSLAHERWFRWTTGSCLDE